jgi:hypothetical protein
MDLQYLNVPMLFRQGMEYGFFLFALLLQLAVHREIPASLCLGSSFNVLFYYELSACLMGCLSSIVCCLPVTV